MLEVVITGLIIAGTVVAAVDEAMHNGRELTDWGIVLIGIALIIWRIT